MTKHDAIAQATVEKLRAQGYTEGEMKDILGIAAMVMLFLEATHAPLDHKLFPVGLEVAADGVKLAQVLADEKRAKSSSAVTAPASKLAH